ncbi:ClpXP protease specificity-enhancing factor SspB [Brevundimonas sp. 2R-24]|uniref:ClpXP protease specificity-enhancing factor SspB n=1 Tax=Peiella sedimenti TaxID=3061083 RepID=A0ABT8SPK2_9CAUL|nr:ClpXP protease specificity-enhancing factor SspB [Caulobacteraceae bacterium XZ-24]
MAEDGAPSDLIDYQAMAQEALRGVVRMALRRAGEPDGLPGEHSLYITFDTRAAGVSLPEDLAAQYPEEMTIVLQHQFWDLAPGETFFSVVLRFKGVPRKLSIPYAAITRFLDPAAQFGLQFDPPALPEAPEPPAASETPPEPDDDGPKVVSLEQFRKK